MNVYAIKFNLFAASGAGRSEEGAGEKLLKQLTAFGFGTPDEHCLQLFHFMLLLVVHEGLKVNNTMRSFVLKCKASKSSIRDGFGGKLCKNPCLTMTSSDIWILSLVWCVCVCRYLCKPKPHLYRNNCLVNVQSSFIFSCFCQHPTRWKNLFSGTALVSYSHIQSIHKWIKTLSGF